MEELMKEEKEGVKAAEQEKPKKRRNRKKNRKMRCGRATLRA